MPRKVYKIIWKKNTAKEFILDIQLWKKSVLNFKIHTLGSVNHGRAGNLLETYWKHAGNMLETCWKPAGNLLETCGKHAG
jgi:hypothetical protein